MDEQYPLAEAIEELENLAEVNWRKSRENTVYLDDAIRIVEELEVRLLNYWERKKLNNK